MARPAKNGGSRNERPRARPAARGGGAPPHAIIAERAYELFMRRGGEHGHDFEDWLTAERELSADVAD